MTDIQMSQGDTYEFDVFATRDDAPVDLTGGKVWFTIKRNRRDVDASALVQRDSTDGTQQVRILNAVAGQIRVKIAPTDTVNLAPSYYPFDVQIRESNGTISTPEDGFVELDPATTRTVA